MTYTLPIACTLVALMAGKTLSNFYAELTNTQQQPTASNIMSPDNTWQYTC